MRNVWFSWFNFVCLLFVIYEHLNAVEHVLFVYKIGMLVIPIFSIIAGYSWGVFLKRTNGEGGIYALKMLLCPYLFWVGVYFLMNNVVLDVIIRGRPMEWPTAYRWATIVLYGNVCAHLYFLAVLILMSALTVWFRRLSKKDGVFYAMVTLVGVSSLAFPLLHLPNRYSASFIQEYVCWVIPNICCGILLAIPNASTYKRKSVVLFSVFLLVVGAVIHWYVDGHASSIVLSCAIISLTMAHPKVYAPKWLVATAPYIMGIYLVHGLVDAGVSEVQKKVGVELLEPIVAWPISVAVFFVSLAAVWIQRKIPYLRNFV